jgi:hypothetical protein
MIDHDGIVRPDFRFVSGPFHRGRHGVVRSPVRGQMSNAPDLTQRRKDETAMAANEQVQSQQNASSVDASLTRHGGLCYGARG